MSISCSSILNKHKWLSLDKMASIGRFGQKHISIQFSTVCYRYFLINVEINMLLRLMVPLLSLQKSRIGYFRERDKKMKAVEYRIIIPGRNIFYHNLSLGKGVINLG